MIPLINIWIRAIRLNNVIISDIFFIFLSRYLSNRLLISNFFLFSILFIPVRWMFWNISWMNCPFLKTQIKWTCRSFCTPHYNLTMFRSSTLFPAKFTNRFITKLPCTRTCKIIVFINSSNFFCSIRQLNYARFRGLGSLFLLSIFNL